MKVISQYINTMVLNLSLVLLSFFLFNPVQTAHYECECLGSKMSIELQAGFKENIQYMRHGKIVNLGFEDKGVISVFCLVDTVLPVTDTLANAPSTYLEKPGKVEIKGSKDASADTVWREDVYNKAISIQYLTLRPHMSEFEEMLDSVELIKED